MMDVLAELEKRVGLIIQGNDLQPTMVGYKDILDTVATGIYFVDRERKIIYWNRGAEIISGHKCEEVLGRPCSDNILVHVNDQGESLCEGSCPLADTMADGQPRQARVFLNFKAGHRLPVLVYTSAIRGDHGNIIGGIEIFNDISSPIAAIERLENLQDSTQLDPLSGVVTHPYLETFITDRLEELKKFNLPFGIIATDIDDLEHVIDHYGTEAGNQTIHLVAQTLAKNSRSFDLVGRWGKSGFICVYLNEQAESLRQMAEKLRHLVGQSRLPHKTGSIQVTLSGGATLARPEDTPATLVQRARDLLNQSISAGGNQVTLG
jgi:diguanylate cyclase (GGDEF)-like protein/PAS domain S-box-containing protein